MNYIKLFEDFHNGNGSVLNIGDFVSLNEIKLSMYFHHLLNDEILDRYNKDNPNFFQYDTLYKVIGIDKKKYGNSVGYVVTIERNGSTDTIDSTFLKLESGLN